VPVELIGKKGIVARPGLRFLNIRALLNSVFEILKARSVTCNGGSWAHEATYQHREVFRTAGRRGDDLDLGP